MIKEIISRHDMRHHHIKSAMPGIIYYRKAIESLREKDIDEELLAFQRYGIGVFVENEEGSSVSSEPQVMVMSEPEREMTSEDIEKAIAYQQRCQNMFFAKRAVSGLGISDLPLVLQRYAKNHSAQIVALFGEAKKKIEEERFAQRGQ